MVGPLTRGRLTTVFGGAAAGAWVLVAAVVAALVWANLWPGAYAHLWLHPVAVGSGPFRDLTTVRAWINSALMSIFFLVVGLEIARERRHGELSDLSTAVVPVAGAVGGMAGAGLVYALIAHRGLGSSGWGIPMATDIAFALAALALLGRHVPAGLRVFLLTLAVADDVGSVIVLAVWYSGRTAAIPLVAAGLLVGAMVLVGRRHRVPTIVVLLLGVLLWVLLAAGGVEPALAGVVTGLLVPGTAMHGRDRSGLVEDPVSDVERRLAPWSAFVVLPIFAVANAGITVHAGQLGGPSTANVFWAVAAARVIGKTIGIPAAAFVVVGLGLGRLPSGLRWRHVIGGAAVAGIGFTVPLLVAQQAFPSDPNLVSAAEIGLIAGSLVAVALGAALLWTANRRSVVGPDGTPSESTHRPDGEPPSVSGVDLPW